MQCLGSFRPTFTLSESNVQAHRREPLAASEVPAQGDLLGQGQKIIKCTRQSHSNSCQFPKLITHTGCTYTDHAQLVCSLAVLWATYSRFFWSGLVGANMTTKLQWIFQDFASAFLSRNSSRLRHLDSVMEDGSFTGSHKGCYSKFSTSAMLQEPEPTLSGSDDACS